MTASEAGREAETASEAGREAVIASGLGPWSQNLVCLLSASLVCLLSASECFELFHFHTLSHSGAQIKL